MLSLFGEGVTLILNFRFQNFKMKTLIRFFLFVALLSFNACTDENESAESDLFQVEVLGKGMDCGDLFLVRFETEKEADINKYLEETNAYFPVFYAVGLPEELKQEGLFLDIRLGECTVDDIPVCTHLGPGYGVVCIESAVPVD